MSAIDLRSDTVTKPSAAMRRAMADAEVGDDVLDGDPTVRKLEDAVAELLGTDGALFFPTGTMANQAGIGLCTRPGTEILLEANAHLVHYEIAGVAALWGVQIRPVQTPDGVLTADLIRAMVRTPTPHVPRLSAIAIENTHNSAGGRVMRPDLVDGIGALATELGVPLHLDGARLWNAAAACGVKPARLARPARTVMVAFTKALGCPVGSALGFRGVDRADAWEVRKRLGGGMRQSGILAAAALYALEHNLDRIGEDHEKAKRIAAKLEGHKAIKPVPPDSNIVMLDLVDPAAKGEDARATLAQAGVLVSQFGPRRLRAITHMDVSPAECERAADIIAKTLS